MLVEQFVMAYKVEQDRIRAMLPEPFESLRSVAAYGKRGWLNIAHWDSSMEAISYEYQGKSVSFHSEFLDVRYIGVGRIGGCPAEKDNDGCFFIEEEPYLRPAEVIDSHKEYCDCEFCWKFEEDNAKGISVGGDSVPAFLTEIKRQYDREQFSAQTAAKIPCEQILGSYRVLFTRC